jgi:hypothetical protein
MAKTQVYKMHARVGRGWTALARVQLPDGTRISQSALTSISRIVKRGATTTGAQTAVTIATSVYNTIRSPTEDSRWTKDDTGFNFEDEVPAAAFDQVANFRVEYLFTPTSGQVFSVVFAGPAESAFTFA